MKSSIFRNLLVVLILPIVFSSRVYPQSFGNFLDRVGMIPDSLRQEAVDSFMSGQKSFPLIEQDTVVYFVYRGSANSIGVPGDADGWSKDDLKMKNVSGTDLWYLRQVYPPDSRLDYKFVLNDSIWVLDPLNPDKILEGLGENSELQMRDYKAPPEIEYYKDIPHGAVEDTTWYSMALGNSRKIVIYLPADYRRSTSKYPVMYFQDGEQSVALGKFENVIDYLVAAKKIRPIIAVFVPFVNRTPEYAGNQVSAFMSFYVNELVPYIDSHYRTLALPKDRGVMGASFGGNISLRLASSYPGVFGNVGAQSSYVDSVVSKVFASGPKMDLTLYMDLGRYDIPLLVPMVRNLVAVLNERAYKYDFQEYNEGHSWGNWRAHVKDALELFFPPNRK